MNDAVDLEVNRMAEEAARAAPVAVEPPPLVLRGVADMAEVGAFGDDDDD